MRYLLLLTLLFVSLSAGAQDYYREKRWSDQRFSR